jgi:hypothetical protein
MRRGPRPGAQAADDVEVPFGEAVHAGTTDLDHHPLAGPQRRRVHLRDRGRRERLVLDFRKDLGPAEFLAEHLLVAPPRPVPPRHSGRRPHWVKMRTICQ